MADTLYLVDGTAYIFRSFYAIRGLRNSQGLPTNAAYGFARMMLKLLREQDPAYVAVVFDAPGKTFRSALYPEYKMNRQAPPEELNEQVPMVDDIVDAINLPRVRVDGVEADDVIGTLARQAEAESMDVVLVTGDKDFFQLVSSRVRIYDPSKGDDGAWYGPEAVHERFGGPPEAVVDAMALIGDSSDNVPGVNGIGEKGAKKLIEQFGTLAGVYDHIGELKGKQRERLETQREQAELSRVLVTIKTDVPLDVGPRDFQRREFDRDRMAEVFGRLEFSTLLEEFSPNPDESEDLDYRIVETLEQLDAVVAEMREAGEFAVDTETTNVEPMRARLVGVSLSCREQTGWYVPVGHTAPGGEDDLAAGEAPPQLPLDAVLARLKPLLEDPAIGKTGHNLKYDIVVFARAGIELRGLQFDTMVGSYLTDPSHVRHNLNEVSLHYLKRKLIPISDLIGKGSSAITFDKVPIGTACPYACEDADIAWRLTRLLRPLLRERGVMPLFEEVERPLIGVLAGMEQTGVAIDAGLFDELQREVSAKLAALEKTIFDEAGEAFQVNSPKQLQDILFRKLKLRPVRKTKTGYSTDQEVLEELALEHPLPALILEYRALEKLRGTYIEALPKLVNPDTGRIHTSFNQAVAATGRLSSSDPNLQNIPVRSETGARIRQGFIPGGTDMRLIAADYSQIELRVLAHLSGDAAMREAFDAGEDIHAATAARVFGVMPAMVDASMRRQAKTVNFGVIYGQSAFGLAKSLGIGRGEAAAFIEGYFAQFPAIRQWIDRTLAEGRRDGYVKTLLGRRRYMPELNAKTGHELRAAERMAINAPVQGSAADIIKVAMVRLDVALRDTPARLLLQVHDELLVETPADAAEDVAETMRGIMEGAYDLDVPLKVDVGIGRNWAEAH